VLISKHTPWQNLADQKAGWDVSGNLLSNAIQTLVEMDQVIYQTWSEGAKNYHQMVIEEEQENKIQAYKTLFTS
jgi:hypothetical protein